MSLRQQMFDLGADALEILAPTLPERGYACPQCLKLFTQEHLDNRTLTIEHVPPKSLNGRPLLLTCKPCNNRAGRLDAEWRKRQNLIDFMSGSLSKPLKGQVLKIGDAEFPVSVRQAGSTFQFWGAPQATHPDNLSKAVKEMDRLVDLGDEAKETTFQLTGFSHRPREAKLSILRMAYLIGFAMWGYTYAAHESLILVRDQLNNPDEEVLNWLAVASSNHDWDDSSLVVEVTEPIRGVLVKYGKHGSVLPLAGSDPNPYAVLGEPVHLKFGQARHWPTSLELSADFTRGA